MACIARLVETAADVLLAPNPKVPEDGLVEMTRSHPDRAFAFLMRITHFNIVSGLLGPLLCGFFFMLDSDIGISCGRPLRFWLVFNAILQLLQVPGRLVFYARLRQASSDRSIIKCVADFTTSLIWRGGKVVAIATYCWLVIGVIWLLRARTCPSCRGILGLTTLMLFGAAARAAYAFACFWSAFPSSAEVDQGGSTPVVQGATSEEIARLPKLLFHPEHFPADHEPSCVVCLGDYAAGDACCRLPCGHHFHRACAGRWLRRSKLCPLCRSPFDTEPVAEALSALRRRCL